MRASRLYSIAPAVVLLVVGPDLRAVPDSTSAATPHPLTLGLIAPPSEPEATSLIRGAQLAVDTVNASGQPSVALETRSEAGQWGSVGNDAVFFVTQRNVDAVITSADGADTHLILQVSGRTRVPVATLCADTSVTAAGIPWMVRIPPTTQAQAQLLFTAARTRDGLRHRWWVVTPVGRPARVIRHDLERAARETDASLDRFLELDSKSDPLSAAKAIADAAPEGVLLWINPTQAGAMTAALRSTGYGGRIGGPCILASPSFVAAAKGTANDVIIPDWRPDERTAARRAEFSKRFRAQFGAEPDCTARFAYDAVLALVDALHETKRGGAYAGFPIAHEILGVTGAMHFDSAGNRTDALEVVTYRDGNWQ